MRRSLSRGRRSRFFRCTSNCSIHVACNELLTLPNFLAPNLPAGQTVCGKPGVPTSNASPTASGLDSRGGVSRSRAFDYSVFASELFNEVVVEKSWSAAQEEGGIGGTVGLRTGKPFDYAKDTLVLSAKGQVNQYTDKLTPRLVGLASAHRGDFGVLVSAAYSSADTIEWGYRNWNWSQMNWGEDNVAPSITGPIRDQLVNATGSERVWNSRAQTYGSWFNHRERLGLTGTLQYNPGNGTDVTLDVLYSRLTNDRAENIIGNAGDNGLDANDVTGTQQLQSVTIDSHGSITDAVVSGVDLRSEAKPTQDSTDFWQVALNGRTDLTDRLARLAAHVASSTEAGVATALPSHEWPAWMCAPHAFVAPIDGW